ncbi:hypothetical protein DFH94DRAFT_841838 [Russula ochroleuca]|uniref:Uncharacterized protein n=1 Tax=Russula ochroleuca TaxID=152965 RepID=A0A9P5N3W0_9AGAM|nr:hypothetical protein DFH94DRAFT_841838 [Russula ochroleuca]
MTVGPFTAAGGLVIPHGEARASARHHRCPTILSPEVFIPAMARPVVRLRPPFGDVRQDQEVGIQYEIGIGTYQGRARSVRGLMGSFLGRRQRRLRGTCEAERTSLNL